LIDYDGRLRLLEIAMVPPDKVLWFSPTKQKFHFFCWLWDWISKGRFIDFVLSFYRLKNSSPSRSSKFSIRIIFG
jgi:hypothetical protein